jgi:hypothetical protein
MRYKLGIVRGDLWVEHSHPPVYERFDMGGGHGERLQVAVPGGDPEVFRSLLTCIEPPFMLLYVLHTPRGEGEPGRYQSPPVDRAAVEDFLARFSDYLRSDGRFHLWARSQSSNASLVWDNHNIIYAYGPLDDYGQQLNRLGFAEGSSPISFAHTHNYRPECDADAAAVLGLWEWYKTPLQPSDS